MDLASCVCQDFRSQIALPFERSIQVLGYPRVAKVSGHVGFGLALT